MEIALSHLNAGSWVHMFPEGKVNENPSRLLNFKWGVARLILDSKKPPVLMTFWHDGKFNISKSLLIFFFYLRLSYSRRHEK